MGHANTKKNEVVILILDELTFSRKKITKDKEEYCLMIKGLFIKNAYGFQCV